MNPAKQGPTDAVGVPADAPYRMRCFGSAESDAPPCTQFIIVPFAAFESGQALHACLSQGGWSVGLGAWGHPGDAEPRGHCYDGLCPEHTREVLGKMQAMRSKPMAGRNTVVEAALNAALAGKKL